MAENAGGCKGRRRRQLQRALHLFDPVALDHVADAHVLVALERHAAFLADKHFARIILEALELRELAFVDHHVVADEPDVGAALNDLRNRKTRGRLVLTIGDDTT